MNFENRRTESVESSLQYVEQFMERMRDPLYLPTRYEIFKSIDITSAANNRDEARRLWKDILANRDRSIHDIYTKEYIEALAVSVAWRVAALRAKLGRKVRIHETAAGDGRLTWHLRKALAAEVPGQFEFTASDSGKNGFKTVGSVAKLDYREALAIYKPNIVIQAWMPYEVDFSEDFRKTESVQEYILIGEPDSTGSYKTWGSGIDEEGNYQEESQLSYEKDGFESFQYNSLHKLQICRVDVAMRLIGDIDDESISRTISFARK